MKSELNIWGCPRGYIPFWLAAVILIDVPVIVALIIFKLLGWY